MKRFCVWLAILVWLGCAFQCKFLEEFIDSGDDVGDYTRVEMRIRVDFSGLNSMGTRSVTIDGVDELEEDFYYDETAGAEDDCATARADLSHTFDVTVTRDSFRIRLEYRDWDYVHFSYVEENFKILCSEWSATVISYEYEEDKADPGEPVIRGLEDLEMEADSDCQPDGERLHQCEISALITLERGH